ncbi:Myristoyl-CoA:protein N-myristoyltransferase,Myristoyl-CoA:protein N- [Cinara cedri]|uniref:Glycylpeptide N-tetradecanoyltransferase n=1 Tax=Cinara cedri TaxID=506608 RepID=A0A5E4MN67_9HEMI|nr:Myristoyl-CoA:protein N-myristoyltransferase,Myristoyl-CoA:protein N- [Cinara cedri]
MSENPTNPSEQPAESASIEATKSKKKRNRNRKNSVKAEQTSRNGTVEETTLPSTISIQDIQKAMEVFSLQQRAAKTPEEALHKQYRFWYTQPVPKMNETIINDGPIEEDKMVDQIRVEPFTLPAGFIWDTLSLDDPFVLKELYTLLNENYVEDEDSMFRFDYQPHFLKWALQPPGWLKEWHVGVRVIKSKKLVGFISAIPATLKVYDKSQKMVEINFLCVHKKLRSKRVAPVLIREITRRVNQMGIFQAVYTAGIVLPKPIGTCRYWHRSLNPKKLIDVKFSHLSRNMTMQRTLKLHKLPESTRTPGFRKLLAEDLPQARKLLSDYLQTFDLSSTFSEEEFKHWFLPQDGIIDAYVVVKDKKITDLVSFYTLPSTIMHHPTYRTLKAAYSFYNVSTQTPWVDLMQDALISARNANFDVFNALDLMDNKEFLEPLKFGVGDGNLQYYLYNWKCPEINSNKIGLILQ